MHFTGTIWRPPYEAHSALLQITVGCTHDKCKFCSLYEHRFVLSPLSEIEDDLKEISTLNRNVKRVFLTGANPFALSFDKLKELALMIKHHLPSVESIGCFSRVTDISPKTTEQLSELQLLGYDEIIFGTECGDDPTLKFMCKGYSSSDIVEQLNKLDGVGIRYHISYLNGLSGFGNGQRVALSTAKTYNQINPISISFVALTVFPQSDLYQEIKSGNFTEAGELERLHEQKTMIEKLEIETTIYANTISNTAPLVGALPKDKAAMIKHLQYAIDNVDETELRRYRENIRHL
ncbi:MAG: radical SAM protein [Defluviitaleaceae bacterium]|nr:radical SAM protein [Defluviitaleaceae bacterium]